MVCGRRGGAECVSDVAVGEDEWVEAGREEEGSCGFADGGGGGDPGGGGGGRGRGAVEWGEEGGTEEG